MEKEMSNNQNYNTSEPYKDPNLDEVLIEIEMIKVKIEQFNMKINNSL